jgi:hypothetical protein
MPSETYEPKGIKFFEMGSKHELLLVVEGSWAGWLLYRHPDGQWVSLRKATQDDLAKIEQRIANKEQ